MGIFDNLKRNHYRSLGQSDAIWVLKTTSDVDMTKLKEADLYQISQPIFEMLNLNFKNWKKEDFALLFIIVCGHQYVESRVATKLFYDAALTYIRSNYLAFDVEILEYCEGYIEKWNSMHKFNG